MPSSPQRPPTELSDLALAVLGTVWKHGPCTTYAVRKCFQASPTPEWSGSAGAIYPLVERLERRGLLDAETVDPDGGGRGARLLRLTPAGRRTLKNWLRPPLPIAAASTIFDPIRTRAFFLGALAPKERLTFLGEVDERLREHLGLIEANCLELKRQKDEFGFLAARGALLAARARLKWIAEVRERLSARPRSGSSD